MAGVPLAPDAVAGGGAAGQGLRDLGRPSACPSDTTGRRSSCGQKMY